MCGYDGAQCQYAVAPPAVLQRLLQATLGPTVTVQNNGVGGSILNGQLNGGHFLPLATRLATSPAGIVLENSGLNEGRATRAQLRIDLNDWVDTVRAFGKIPVIEEPNPSSYPNPVLDEIVAIIDDVAAQRNVVLIKQYDYIKSLPNYQAMLPDGIHPTPELYAIKAQREYDVLLPIVRSLQ